MVGHLYEWGDKMGRVHKKKTKFYQKIIDNTACIKTGNSYLLRSIDTKEKIINYIIHEELFFSCINKIIEYAKFSGEITIYEASNLLYAEIYKIYKTKISTVRLPLLLLNVLVKENILYSDNNEDYILKGSISNFTKCYIDDFKK